MDPVLEGVSLQTPLRTAAIENRRGGMRIKCIYSRLRPLCYPVRYLGGKDVSCKSGTSHRKNNTRRASVRIPHPVHDSHSLLRGGSSQPGTDMNIRSPPPSCPLTNSGEAQLALLKFAAFAASSAGDAFLKPEDALLNCLPDSLQDLLAL